MIVQKIQAFQNVQIVRPGCRGPSLNVPFGDHLNLSPSGEVKVRHADERRHPGSFSVQVQKPSGFRLAPE